MVRAAALATALLVGCAPTATSPSMPIGAPTTTASGTLPGSTSANPVAGQWNTYMGDPIRSGVGPASPASALPRRTWTARVDGDVYAQPLVSGLSVIVATEGDSLYSLDASTGAARWHNHLGTPVPLSSLECGNIDPNGITSTPVIDAAAGVVYAVAMLDAPTVHHELFAVRLSDGATMWHRLIDPPNQDATVHQQRGALNLSREHVYVVFGGFTGDCGNYHGWVVASPTAPSGALQTWEVPSGKLGAIWAPPGPVIAPDGDVWVSTGNTDAGTNGTIDPWDGGNGVFRLGPALGSAMERWTSTDWADLNRSDTDLGSDSPALLPGGLVLAVGKEGIGYLLRTGHLGGVGGEVFSKSVCQGGPTAGAFGGPAVVGPMAYVPCKDGLTALRVDAAAPSFSVVWKVVPGANTATLAYGLVWTVGADPAGYRDSWKGALVGLDASSGAERVRLTLGPIPHFVSPAASGGALYIGGRGVVYAAMVA